LQYKFARNIIPQTILPPLRRIKGIQNSPRFPITLAGAFVLKRASLN
jgi:hypothetical protein